MLASPKNCQWFHIKNHLRMSSSGTHPSFPIEKMTSWLLHPVVHDLQPMWGPARSRPQSCHAPDVCRSDACTTEKTTEENLQKILQFNPEKNQQKSPAKISLLVYFYLKKNCWDKEAFWTIQAFTILLTGTTSAALTASNQHVNSWGETHPVAVFM